MLFSTSSLEASSGKTGNTSNKVYIGDNPAHFTFMTNGKPDAETAEGLRDSVGTGLWEMGSSSECSRPYGTVGSEDPKIVAMLEKEINLSQSIYADPATRLKRRFIKATHLVKGHGTLGKGRATIDLRIEDRQGNITAQEKVSGPEKDFLKLIDEASKSLGYQMCKPEPSVQTSCPYLWDVTFKQSGTIDTNSCLGSGLSGEDAISQIDGYAYFPNVLIRPSASYELTWKEDDACEYYSKNDIQNNYRARSKGNTYQKVDGYDGMDVDAVSLRVLNINKGEKSMIFEFGSVPIADVLSKIAGFKRPEDRRSFVITEGCNQTFTFSPIPVYGN